MSLLINVVPARNSYTTRRVSLVAHCQASQGQCTSQWPLRNPTPTPTMQAIYKAYKVAHVTRTARLYGHVTQGAK